LRGGVAPEAISSVARGKTPWQKPLAAIVPYSTYEQFERRRKAAFRVFHEIWETNKDDDPDEVAEAVDRAVAEIRRERRSRKVR